MNNYRFSVKGQERKSLVSAISEILNTPVNYLGAPTFAYEVGDYRIDKEGTVTGEYDPILFVSLAERGFEPEAVHADVPESVPMDVLETAQADVPDAPADGTFGLSISYPAEGFTDEAFANLEKLVASKAPLIKKALGIDELPIGRGTEEIIFDWFRTGYTAEETSAFAQFITCLCTTAKEKKRVTAKAPDHFENEKFALRVWLIGLGLIGKEYGAIRKLMTANLSGDSAWRYGKPVKAAEKAAPAPETAGDAFAEDTPVVESLRRK